MLADFLRGCRFPFQGIAFLARHRSLWTWAALPAAVNVGVFAAALGVFLYFFGTLYSLTTGWMYPAAPDFWLAWAWVVPLRVFAWSIGVVLLLAALLILYGAFLALGLVIAAPFLALLSQRVEMLVTGKQAPDAASWKAVLATVLESVVDEFRKVAFFVGVQLVLWVLGLLLPFLAPITVAVAMLFTLVFMPLEYAGFAMDSRHLRFAQRRALVWRHRWLMLGFGASASLSLLLPLLNFVCMPALVVGGTLMLLHLEAPAGPAPPDSPPAAL